MSDKEKEGYTACMEIAAAESIPDMNYEPPEADKK